jgi:hypothetical protein
MHKEWAWLFLEHVIVKRSDLNSILPESLDHRIHFAT